MAGDSGDSIQLTQICNCDSMGRILISLFVN
jgi:hypothetical protein